MGEGKKRMEYIEVRTQWRVISVTIDQNVKWLMHRTFEWVSQHGHRGSPLAMTIIKSMFTMNIV